MCDFFSYLKNPHLSMFVWIRSQNTLVYEVYKVSNVGNGVILSTLVVTTKNIKPFTYIEIESWKSIFWACWHHWSMALKGWVTEFQFHEVALCFLEQPLTFSHFRRSQFSWSVDVIVIVLSSLLHSFGYAGDLILLVAISLVINYESVFWCPTCFWSLVCLVLPSRPSICRITRQLARKPAQ